MEKIKLAFSSLLEKFNKISGFLEEKQIPEKIKNDKRVKFVKKNCYDDFKGKDFSELIRDKKFLAVISIILAIVIIFTTLFSVIAGISGKNVKCKKEVKAYNEAVVSYSMLSKAMTEDVLAAEIDQLEKELLDILSSADIDSLIYSDEAVTSVTKYTAEFLGKDFASLEFSELEKDYPEAYEYINIKKSEGATWDTVGVIPFGVASGDKEAFVVACGAAADFVGDTLPKIMKYELSCYYDALVASLEATHTTVMPGFLGFVFKTGFSGRDRTEFIAEKIVTVIEQVRNAPITYLCDILPDFIINYTAACELINADEKITTKLGVTLPTIDLIVKDVISALGMTAPEIDYSYISKMGTASIGDSGKDGERVVINGDREAIFAYLTDVLHNIIIYQNNIAGAEKLLSHTLKSDAVRTNAFARIFTGEKTDIMIAHLMDILASLKARTPADAATQVQSYNNETKDFSSLFGSIMTRENIATSINSIDATISQALAESNIDALFFSDKLATEITRVIGKLCGKDFTTIGFYALRNSFPQAYNYIRSQQAAGKTWDDLETIPFGITPGNQERFIEACGAGTEHFGDTLALCLAVDPHAYDEALVPILEALHTGAMPSLEKFVSGQGLDGAERMEDVISKVITILGPIKSTPITYFCQVLPDLIASYNKAAAYMNANPASPLKLPAINELVNTSLSNTGIKAPDFDFTQIEKMGTAAVAESGAFSGTRMEIAGDREVVFVTLAQYFADILGYEHNNEMIAALLSEAIDINRDTVYTILGIIDSIGGLITGSKAA